jgi:hypothetical protein
MLGCTGGVGFLRLRTRNVPGAYPNQGPEPVDMQGHPINVDKTGRPQSARVLNRVHDTVHDRGTIKSAGVDSLARYGTVW